MISTSCAILGWESVFMTVISLRTYSAAVVYMAVLLRSYAVLFLS
jgi:hypothetical protein